MKNKTLTITYFISIILAFAFSVAITALALDSLPELAKPKKPGLYMSKNTMNEQVINIRVPIPESLRDIPAKYPDGTILVEFDFRADRGEWFADRQPERVKDDPLQVYFLEGFKYRFLAYDVTDDVKNGMKEYDSAFESFMFGLTELWDLKNHSYSFRCRFVFERQSGNRYEESSSPWSDEVSIGTVSY